VPWTSSTVSALRARPDFLDAEEPVFENGSRTDKTPASSAGDLHARAAFRDSPPTS